MTRSIENTPQPTASERTVSELVQLAQQTYGSGLTPREEAAGLLRFEQAVARKTLQRRGRLAWLFGFSMAAAAAAGVSFWMTSREPRSAVLTFSVVGGSVSDGGYVRAGATPGTELRFSDGSTLALDPGTSTRITDLNANGSRVLLESGYARVHVTPRPRARWTVDAGPYSVRVVGTEFDIRWSGSEEMFDVALHKGSIIVTGPLATRGLTMEAGQHLVANVKQGEIFLDRAPRTGSTGATGATQAEAEALGDEAAPPAAARPEPTPPADVGARGAERALPAPSGARGTHARSGLPVAGAVASAASDSPSASWSKRVAEGDFRGVVAEAQRRGLDATLGAAPAPELAALADAARYVLRRDVARRALLAERERFPKSREGREAAFFLGGLSEDEPGAEASRAALDWYDHYLSDSPQGAYAPHALGREMVLVHRLRGAEAARPIAVEYLRRFPNGPYAGPARKLTEAR
jgi:ferric-dicitrate binding protein FerR (iron transport regulator)